MGRLTDGHTDRDSSRDPNVELIRRELVRIGAAPGRADEADSIDCNQEGEGWASLGVSELRADFYWYGPAVEILRRLQALPSDTGPEVVRAEFHRGFGDPTT